MFDLLDEAVQILKINSVTTSGTVEIVKYLSKLLNKCGLATDIQKTQVHGIDQHNLLCRINGKTQDQVIFNTHLDTVPPGDPSLWTKTNGDPFNPTVIDNRIYGLGSADITYWNGFIIRALPPNGIMPSVNFGSLQSISTSKKLSVNFVANSINTFIYGVNRNR